MSVPISPVVQECVPEAGGKTRRLTRRRHACRGVLEGPNKEDYLMPAAAHELGAIAWAECCRPAEAAATADEAAAYRRERLDECQAHLDKARTWEAYSLEARLGMRVQCGLETVRWLRRKLEAGQEGG